MNWWNLISALLPLVQEVITAVGQAQAAGKSPDTIHSTVTDHVAQLPAKIRE